MIAACNKSCHLPSRFDEAAEVLRRRGVLLRKHPGFYSVCLRHDRDEDAYQTEDFIDAFNHGMAMDVPPPLPPLGPLGHGPTRRALMYRHNRKLAAKRAAKKADAGQKDLRKD